MISKLEKDKRNIYDLIEIVEALRKENGCPWDREQTHESIKKAIIEESYEVMDAIDKADEEGTVEELGDVLLQVVFHSVLGKEEGRYDLGDIIDGICNKMVYRHPHVFGNDKVENTEEVMVSWDELKKKEKNLETTTDELKAVARALPALIRAEKVQGKAKAKTVGHELDKVEDVALKVKQELEEVLDVYRSKNRAMITEEVGDLLFACVNISRFLNVDPEEALNMATDKFIRKFSYIEEKVREEGLDSKKILYEEMDGLYNQVK
ncbi:nucleoside triphosphate pyrophosphohydrolase [Clostridium vincentii]|uniref:Nucleoside triphosphate pyrophosphohydrolase n=1 Tax=Clostridium vincentii TaxID=52704 RepID=A0A2T0BHF3_9CLOT|nr:nucleoside triphosphate pyrophosphohydrolase [Clostridium vincentii]PRR83326.1 Nucleoside triphosphate pyrophosphohydrolase [Clostridium vincentii]